LLLLILIHSIRVSEVHLDLMLETLLSLLNMLLEYLRFVGHLILSLERLHHSRSGKSLSNIGILFHGLNHVLPIKHIICILFLLLISLSCKNFI